MRLRTNFALYPEKLIKPCILAGSEKGDIVLDPFFGSGTTGAVAKRLGREYIGIELNPKYCEKARDRLEKTTQRMAEQGMAKSKKSEAG